MSSTNNKHSPGKITLGMMKGKPITTSVPVIHYHANDDELEELYPSTDDDKELTPESEKHSPSVPLSPSKSPDKKVKDGESSDSNMDKRSLSMDGNISEGTPPHSDPWKVFSEIKGKLTKTFEEKLSEIKCEKKKRNQRSRENSSISDSEDIGNVTPTEENVSEKQEKEILSLPTPRKDSSRFASFSHIKTGLKTKNSEEDSVESGIEAAEFAEDIPEGGCFETDTNNDISKNHTSRSNENIYSDAQQLPAFSMVYSVQIKPDKMLPVLKSQLYKLFYQLVTLLVIISGSYYILPLPDYILGFAAGVFMTTTFLNIVKQLKKILTTLPEEEVCQRPTVPVLEIPAAEEHAVVERFDGWLNELPYTYDPENYHVARTKSVFFRLEGNMLRVMEARLKIPKRAIWDEPKHKLKFTRKRVYNLASAKVELLPEGLIRRRRWSKKYPICITLGRDNLLENVALKESSKETQLIQDGKETIVEETETEKTEQQNVKEQEPEEEEEEEEEEDEETDDDFTQSNNDIFEDCEEGDENNAKYKMFIFARADRQKEDWYRRLYAAANLVRKGNSISLTNDAPISLNSLLTQQALSDSKTATATDTGSSTPNELSYNTYMARYLDTHSPATLESDQPVLASDTVWINCLLGRILFDMHKCPDTVNLIQDKIQRKLSNIKLPYFMESLLVSEVVIGQGAPIIHKVSKPMMDERGLWLDLNITYKGCLTMTVETKLNLMKLTRAGSVSSNSSDVLSIEKPKATRSPMFDSDVEDSPETSTEDEDAANTPMCNTSKELTPSQSSGKKFLSMVDKIAANKYFQHATELSYVKRAMKGVSNTEIRLMVSVSSIEGWLSVNIPPAPADRLWYGFKPVPKVTLTVKPAVGERAVNIAYVTKWIETKLLREFEKVVVLPNMDDLMIPLCPNYPYSTT